MSFVVQNVGRNHDKTRSKDRNIICNNCNNPGHDFDKCFQLIGHPKWWGQLPRETERGST